MNKLAGFHRHRRYLYAPAIDDATFGYARVNVESQQADYSPRMGIVG